MLGVALVADGAKKLGPAMLGKYERNANDLVFTPRFPLEAGQTYRATLKLDGKMLTLDYRVPDPPSQRRRRSSRSTRPRTLCLPITSSFTSTSTARCAAARISSRKLFSSMTRVRKLPTPGLSTKSGTKRTIA